LPFAARRHGEGDARERRVPRPPRSAYALLAGLAVNLAGWACDRDLSRLMTVPAEVAESPCLSLDVVARGPLVFGFFAIEATSARR